MTGPELMKRVRALNDSIARLAAAAPHMTLKDVEAQLLEIGRELHAMRAEWEGLDEWPKQCACCDRTFTKAQWASLTLRGYVGSASGRARTAVELRDCVCTNTLGVEVPMPEARRVSQ